MVQTSVLLFLVGCMVWLVGWLFEKISPTFYISSLTMAISFVVSAAMFFFAGVGG